jgi:hypothetical protein
MTQAERAIHEAAQVVEEAGADVRLTRAGMLLTEARDMVADYVDGVPLRAEKESVDRERLTTIIDEAFGLQPVAENADELLTNLEHLLGKQSTRERNTAMIAERWARWSEQLLLARGKHPGTSGMSHFDAMTAIGDLLVGAESKLSALEAAQAGAGELQASLDIARPIVIAAQNLRDKWSRDDHSPPYTREAQALVDAIDAARDGMRAAYDRAIGMPPGAAGVPR